MLRSVALIGMILGVGPLLADTLAPVERPGQRIEALNREIDRIEGELRQLEGRERGVVGQLTRLEAELKLREREYEESALRLEQIEQEIGDYDARVEELSRSQAERRRYLAFRIREVYKAGSQQWLQRLIGGSGVEAYWQGLGYASYLSQRDGEMLERYRNDALAASQVRTELESARTDAQRLQEEMGQRREAAASARQKQSGALRRIRQDKGQRRSALKELETAAEELTGLVDSLVADEAGASLDVRKFRGLLDRPAEGKVSAGFGRVIHPKFGTEVPHPGWDIDAAFASDIGSVFDGRVVFADWMRGYGLTVIVDHGGGLLSIYAHASVLVVQKGQRVSAGQSLGKVGDTGSLRGAYLYFELRVDGRPVDPREWLRPR